MKAPKKLYVDTEDNLSDSILYGFTKKRKDDDIEYIRKDVFIEKAIEWIDYYNQNGGCEFDGWKEDFCFEIEVNENKKNHRKENRNHISQ